MQQKLEGIDIDKETQVLDSDFDENGEPVFPNNELARLDEMVNRPKWVIPVLPNGELEVLIDAAIKLSKKGTGLLCMHVTYIPAFLRLLFGAVYWCFV